MHSRRLWQKIFGKRPLTLRSVSLKHLKLNYFSKHSFSSNYSSGHLYEFVTTLTKNFFGRRRKILLSLSSDYKRQLKFFRKKTSFPSKCASAHVEVDSDKLVKVLLPKCWEFIERLKYFGSIPKKYSKTDFFWKVFLTSGNVEFIFYKPFGEYLSKAWEKSINVRTDKNYIFFQKENNFTNVILSTRSGRFHNSIENVPAKSGNDLHQCPVLIFLQFL